MVNCHHGLCTSKLVFFQSKACEASAEAFFTLYSMYPRANVSGAPEVVLSKFLVCFTPSTPYLGHKTILCSKNRRIRGSLATSGCMMDCASDGGGAITAVMRSLELCEKTGNGNLGSRAGMKKRQRTARIAMSCGPSKTGAACGGRRGAGTGRGMARLGRWTGNQGSPRQQRAVVLCGGQRGFWK